MVDVTATAMCFAAALKNNSVTKNPAALYLVQPDFLLKLDCLGVSDAHDFIHQQREGGSQHKGCTDNLKHQMRLAHCQRLQNTDAAADVIHQSQTESDNHEGSYS